LRVSRRSFQQAPASLRVCRPSFSTAATSTIDVTVDNLASIESTSRQYEFFQDVEFTPQGVAIIRFDGPKTVNSISFDLSKEAQVLWRKEIASNKEVKAVVFSSGKKDMFIAGADIFDLQSVENKEDLIGLIQEGMDFFQEMRHKGIPLVCAIDGPALGGGLEWAM
jgi:enoyl-CoA hydratase/carnithine racemase